MSRPPSGTMVWWRPVAPESSFRAWRFGYVTYVSGQELIRLGSYSGDSTGGSVVSVYEIEWKPYGSSQ